jgi:hypothetical protein
VTYNSDTQAHPITMMTLACDIMHAVTMHAAVGSALSGAGASAQPKRTPEVPTEQSTACPHMFVLLHTTRRKALLYNSDALRCDPIKRAVLLCRSSRVLVLVRRSHLKLADSGKCSA